MCRSVFSFSHSLLSYANFWGCYLDFSSISELISWVLTWAFLAICSSYVIAVLPFCLSLQYRSCTFLYYYVLVHFPAIKGRYLMILLLYDPGINIRRYFFLFRHFWLQERIYPSFRFRKTEILFVLFHVAMKLTFASFKDYLQCLMSTIDTNVSPFFHPCMILSSYSHCWFYSSFSSFAG